MSLEVANNDIGGCPYLQQQIKQIMHDYQHIFSYNVKGKSMFVPFMQLSVQLDWESKQNRLLSRNLSVEKREALNKMIDDLLELQVIQPSKATGWYQVHLSGNHRGIGASP